MPLPIIDLTTAAGNTRFRALLAKLRYTASGQSRHARAAARIVEDVRRHGDAAIVRLERRWTNPGFTAGRICVPPRELRAALERLDRPLRRAIETSIRHVRRYQQHILPRAPRPVTIDGCEMGLRFTAVESAGLLVPGGAAVLFSTLIMLAVPAIVAGVDPRRLAAVNPPPYRRPGQPARDVSPVFLATCALLGIGRVYRIGGAHAVAALAFGTRSVEPVEMIAGPGHPIVQAAKAQVSGVVGTDNGFYGPSEVLTIADDAADARAVAADLLAQAEHNPGKCFLVAWSRRVIERIAAEVQRQQAQRGRREAIAAALRSESAAVLVRDVEQAAEVADRVAAEHVNLAVRDPWKLLKRLKHGGEFFLGDQTPVAAGDYYAGPSHCLPTGTTARFTSGVSVYTFLKRSGTVWYRRGMPRRAIEDVALLAEAEGLDAHAASVRARG